MAFTFTLKALNAPPGAQCLTTLNAILQAVAKFVQVTSPEGLSGIIIDDAEPGVDDRDKAWIRTEANGQPRGLYIYADGWVLVAGVPIGLIALYSGLVSAIPDGWALCDGTNGTPDLTSNTDFASLWEPNYSAPTTTYTLCPIQYLGLA